MKPSILTFFKKYRVSSALKSAKAYKSKGFSVIDIFRYLFGMTFTNHSMYMLMGKLGAGFQSRSKIQSSISRRKCAKVTDLITPGKSIEFPAPWIEWIEEYSTNGRIIKGNP